MKKRNKILILLLLITSFMAGCGIKKENLKGNYSESNLLNLKEEAYNYESGNLDKRLGLGYSFTEIEKDLNEKGKFNEIFIPNLGYLFSYTTDEGLKTLKKLENQEKSNEIIDFNSIFFDYGLLYRVKNNEKLPGDLENIISMFENKEEIKTLGEYTYYFAWNENIDYLDDLSADDKENIKKLIDNREKFIEETTIFNPVEEESHMRDFNTETILGNNFTNEKFTDYDLTMVNIWSTWCTGCIEEMPELQSLYKNLPENVNMVSICADAKENKELAFNILNKNKCEFETLMPDENLEKSLIKYIDAYPTTVFVDSEGNIVGDIITGAPTGQKEEFTNMYLNLINDRLGLIKGE